MSEVRLNLGCGLDIRPGFTNVDRVQLPGVDVVWDLDDAYPWPWTDGSVREIVAQDVFEHVADPIWFMVECWRVLEDRGILRLKTPHWRHRDAYTDPTHRRYCTEYTFDYWVPGTTLFEQGNAAMGAVAFHKGALDVRNGAIYALLTKTQAQG
jgi:predicted SAM-dependent methyltransferase